MMTQMMPLAAWTRPTMLAGDWTLLFALVFAAGVLVLYGFVYRIEARRLTTTQKWILRSLRMAVTLLGIIMLLRPSVTQQLKQERLPVVPILVDESTSMAYSDRENPLLADSPRDARSRFDGAKAAAQLLQQKLSTTHQVKLFIFSDSLRHIADVPFRDGDETPPMSASDLFPDVKPSGAYTNITDSVTEVLTREEAFKVPGAVLLTDGRQTGGKKVGDVSGFIANSGIPIHTVGLGTEFPLRDLRIDEVIVPTESSLGDVLSFRVVTTNQIADNQPVKVELFQDDKSILQRQVVLKRGQNTVALHTIPEKEGELKFRIVLPRFEDEITYDNNEATVKVKIVKHGLRVIYIAGEPTLEYHYMVPALLRDPILNVSCFLQSADIDYVQQGHASLERLPATLKEWEKYDVAILQDPDPNKLSVAQMAGLEHMVDAGGGLLIIAGRNHGLGQLIQVHSSKIRGLLPVEIDKNLQPNYEQLFSKPFKVKRTSQGMGHPVMFCESNFDVNEQIWSTFPDLYWAHPTQGVKADAISLMQKSDSKSAAGECLMAVQRYGKGAVFYSGINTMWLWRFPYGSYDYDRFWTRAIRYLGETRLKDSQQQVALSTDKQVYPPGDMVKLTLRILDPALQSQLKGSDVFCKLTDSSGADFMQPLRASSENESMYVGNYRALHLGKMTAKVSQIAPKSDSEAKPLFEVGTQFEVKMQSLESLDTSADLDGMAQMSERTGGKHYNYRNMKELAELPALISADKQVLVNEKVIEIWDGLGCLLLFLAAVAAEWSLRKWWGLL